MILSHRYRFIFLKTVKVGGTSVEIALSRVCGPDDVVTPLASEDELLRRELGNGEARNYRKPLAAWTRGDWLKFALTRRAPVRFRNHMTASDVRAAVGERVWNEYFKFTIIRDPFDVAVSMFFYRRYYRNGATGMPEHVREAFREHLLDHPQDLIANRKIYEIEGRPAVDAIVRYESMEQDLAAVSERIGLDSNIHELVRPIRAKGQVRPERGTSTAEMFAGFDEGVQLVSILAERDIALGGYAPPWSG